MNIPTQAEQLEKSKNISIRDRIASDQIHNLYGNSIYSSFASLICAIFVFVVLYTNNHQHILIIWLGLNLLLFVLRSALLLAFYYLTWPDKFNLVVFIVLTMASAALWGMADSVLMPEHYILGQFVIAIIVLSMTSSGIYALQANLISSIGFISLVLIPSIFWFYLQNKNEYLILSGLNLIYLIFLIIIASRNYKLLSTKLKLVYENEEAVKTLTTMNEELQQTYELVTKQKERFHELMLNTPIGTSMADFQGNFIDANDAFCNLFGYTKDELLKMKFTYLSHPDDLQKELELINKVIAGKLDFFQLEKRYFHKNGHVLWMLLTVTTIKSDTGRIFEGQLQDIHIRKEAEFKLIKLNETLVTTLNDLKIREQEGLLINKMNESLQMCIKSKETYPRIRLYILESFPELNGALAIYNESNSMMEVVESWGNAQYLKPQFEAIDCFAIRSDSAIYTDDPIKNLICPHYLFPPQGGYICVPLNINNKILGAIYISAPNKKPISHHQQEFIITLANVIKLTLSNIKLRELLEEQSIHDPLTGLYNRRYLNEHLLLDLQYSIRTNNKLCVAMLDLDLFKNINDTFGHEAGDEVLKFLGKLLRTSFRISDLAYRFGGEEFLVVLRDTDTSSAVTCFKDIQKEISQANIKFQNQHLPKITVSVGIAIAPEQGDTVEAIIFAADQALYKAKALGRDRVEIYQPKSVRDIL